ncbi:MAG: MBL fold metallo-hydrolase [Oligoflexales bacterium]
MKATHIITLVGLLTVSIAEANDDFASVAIKSTAIAPSIYMLEGAGGNITALVGEDGAFLVDDDFEEMAGKLVAKLRELKGDAPRFIVNTHFHYDHTGGNKVFGAKATIIASTGVRNRLMSEQTLWKQQHPAFPPQALPTLTFDKEITLHLNGEDIRIVHFPRSHTDGDTVVFFNKGKIISLGDLYFAGMYPIFHPEHAGTLEGYVQNLRTVLRETPEDGKIVPGHGPLSNKSELELYISMIEASIDTVRRGVAKGRSLEDIQKDGLDKKWESYSHGYVSTDRWIAMIYNECD